MCRAVPRLGAHMLGYAGKTLVRRQIGEKVPFALSFQLSYRPFPAGSRGPKSDLGRQLPKSLLGPRDPAGKGL